MSDKGGGGEIGKMFVSIEARISALEAGLKAGEAATAASGKRMGDNLAAGIGAGTARATAAVEEVAVGRGGFSAWGHSIKSATAGVRGFVGALTAVVGTASRVLGLVGLISSGVYLIGKAATAVWGSVSGSADEAERLKKRTEEMEAVYDRYLQKLKEARGVLQGMTNSPNPEALDPDNYNKVTDQIKALTKAIAENRDEVTRLYDQINAAGNSMQAPMKAELLLKITGLEGMIDKWNAEVQKLGTKIAGMEQQRKNADKTIADAQAQAVAKVLKDFLDKQKQESDKLLQSIAMDAARSRQIAESMQSSQPRGAH